IGGGAGGSPVPLVSGDAVLAVAASALASARSLLVPLLFVRFLAASLGRFVPRLIARLVPIALGLVGGVGPFLAGVGELLRAGGRHPCAPSRRLFRAARQASRSGAGFALASPCRPGSPSRACSPGCRRHSPYRAWPLPRPFRESRSPCLCRDPSRPCLP